MPIAYKTTRYGCVHRCGMRRKITAEQMATHEAVCWMDRANKTCRTCVFENYESDPDNSSMMLRQCDNKKGQKHLDSIYFDLSTESKVHVKPVINCKHWKEKNI